MATTGHGRSWHGRCGTDWWHRLGPPFPPRPVPESQPLMVEPLTQVGGFTFAGLEIPSSENWALAPFYGSLNFSGRWRKLAWL